MEISDQLLCLFSAEITDQNGSFVVELPEQELGLGEIEEGSTYRIAVLPAVTQTETNAAKAESEPAQERGPPEPPVAEGETREVEIEDLGEQGDGIARVERGYVVIVPETEKGERVTVEVTEVRENVAFAEVVERHNHFR